MLAWKRALQARDQLPELGRVSHLAFPDHERTIAHAAQPSEHSTIAHPIRTELPTPEEPIVLRHCCQGAARVSMPEAAVNEHRPMT